MIYSGFFLVRVASFAEAWIEILDDTGANKGAFTVASFAEAWIEILKS